MRMLGQARDNRTAFDRSHCMAEGRLPLEESWRRVSGNRTFGLVVLLGLAGVVFLFCFDPAATWWYPRCILHSVTGLYCAGCGAQRSVHLLLHGRIGAALRANALVVIGIPVGLVWWRFRVKAAPWMVLTAVVLFALLRNMPIWPFTLLVPD
ncbi:MAG: DUF2752 domain-containing protein [Kiritimatiellia bacterium]